MEAGRVECPPSPVSIMEAFPEALILTRFPRTQTRRGLVKAGHTTTLGRGITNTKTESRPATEATAPLSLQRCILRRGPAVRGCRWAFMDAIPPLLVKH